MPEKDQITLPLPCRHVTLHRRAPVSVEKAVLTKKASRSVETLAATGHGGWLGEVPPADPPQPVLDPPRARHRMAARLVSGLADGRTGLGPVGLAEQGVAGQGNV